MNHLPMTSTLVSAFFLEPASDWASFSRRSQTYQQPGRVLRACTGLPAKNCMSSKIISRDLHVTIIIFDAMEKRFHCGHCGEKISKTLHFQHKRLYYSSSTRSWSSDRYKDECVPSSLQVHDSMDTTTSQEVDEFSFSDSEREAGRLLFILNMQE